VSTTIRCIEPGGKPLAASLEIEPGGTFAVYVMEDLDPSQASLRSTILRRGNENAPSGAALLFEATLIGAGERVGLRTVLVNSQVNVEMIRPDVRSRVTSNIEIPSPSRFEINFGDLRTIGFTLEVLGDAARGGKAMVGGGGTRRSNKLEVGGSAAYMVPGIVATLRVPQTKVLQWLTQAAKKLGLSPWMIGSLVGFLFILGGAIWLAATSYIRNKGLEDSMVQMEIDIATAAASRDAALQAEESCLRERADLVQALGDVQKERELLAENALQFSFTRIVATEVGGSRHAGDDPVAFDMTDDVKGKVVAVMGSIRGEAKAAKFCLAQEEYLGNDLPRYTLLWHPDPKVVCPPEYAVVNGGIAQIGRWALSDRVARQYGVAEEVVVQEQVTDNISDLTSDPRMKERWSAHAYSSALRAIQEGMLTAPTGDRPTVAPGQAHLWTLAIFDQYNTMPSSVGGAMDVEADQCAQTLVMQTLGESGPAEPGQPVLPDLVKVANGDIVVEPTPTAGCPWPAQRSFQDSAQSAVRAVAHMATVEGAGGDGSAAAE
jgi:hypothetical protein